MYHQTTHRQTGPQVLNTSRENPSERAMKVTKVLGKHSKDPKHVAQNGTVVATEPGRECCKSIWELSALFEFAATLQNSQASCGDSKIISGSQRLAGERGMNSRTFVGWREAWNVCTC